VTPPPGSYAVVKTGGAVARLIRLATRGTVNHALVYTGGHTVEMNPGGAAYGTVAEYLDEAWYRPPMTDDQLVVFRQAADELVALRVGYSFVDIAAQFAYRVLRVKPARLARFIESPHRMVCSQSVDWLYAQAGVHLFDDGRLPGLVSPEDLRALGEAHPLWRVQG